ncbi:MAG: hypothetical protein JNK63_03565 [Chthonomonas sp.]|nr:hypothetical protein [Chthonomonas sp.]
MRLLLLSLCVLPAIGLAQSPYWVYQSEPMADDCLYPSFAQSGTTPITKTLADDVTAMSLYAGREVTAIASTFYNYNLADVSFRPRIRFWEANGPGSTLGTYLGTTAFTGDAIRMAGYSTENAIFSTAGGDLSVPASKFYVGIALDNDSNGNGMATVSQLNEMGIMPGTVARGTSDANVFRSSAASDLIYSNNPPGAYEYGNLALSLGIPGQDFHGRITLNDVITPMAHGRTIQVTAISGSVTFASEAISMSNLAATDAFWLTVPAVLPTGTTNPISIRIGGQPFLHKTILVQVPVPPSVMPESIDIGTVALTNGDVDGSGEVDAADIDEVIASFGQVFPGVGNEFADLDLSGEVDAADIDLVIANFGAVDE